MPTAPEPSRLPGLVRPAVQLAIAMGGASETTSCSPWPTWTGVPGNQGESDPVSRHVNEPNDPATGSPPSTAIQASGGRGMPGEATIDGSLVADPGAVVRGSLGRPVVATGLAAGGGSAANRAHLHIPHVGTRRRLTIQPTR